MPVTTYYIVSESNTEHFTYTSIIQSRFIEYNTFLKFKHELFRTFLNLLPFSFLFFPFLFFSPIWMSFLIYVASSLFQHFESHLMFRLNMKQSRMREVELGAHTVKSHGVAIARTHLHDWLILLLLGMIQIVLYLIHPFYRFVGKDMMTDLKYPLKDNTVPTWTVPVSFRFVF